MDKMVASLTRCEKLEYYANIYNGEKNEKIMDCAEEAQPTLKRMEACWRT